MFTAGYTAEGLRAWKQSASGRTYFVYDGISPVCELDANGDVLALSAFALAWGVYEIGSALYNKIIYRFGTERESANRLARKADLQDICLSNV